MRLLLKEIRKKSGLTQQELADEMGVDRVHVSRVENGARRANTDFLEGAATALGVSISDLFAKNSIPIVAYVGAGAEFFFIDDHEQGGGLDTVEAPPGVNKDSIAVMVRGESMYPAYFEGDLLFYSKLNHNTERFLNKQCVCRLSDGRTLVKTPTSGSKPGLYTLTSFNAAPIADVALEWCAKIEWVKRKEWED